MVELTASNPAKIFGISNKGQIKENYDADLVIWITNLKILFHTKRINKIVIIIFLKAYKFLAKPKWFLSMVK